MFAHEMALLFVVATPLAILVGINVYLWLGGERGTLMLPGVARFPSIAVSAEEVAPSAVATPEVEVAPANDAFERKAA